MLRGPARSSGIIEGTAEVSFRFLSYNKYMRKSLKLLGACVFVLALAGCEKKAEVNYSALDRSGMFSSNIDELKRLKVSNAEIDQLTKLKQSGASDDTCLALLKAARSHQHEFTAGDSAIHLSSAGYSDAQILEMAQSDQIDILSGDAITLKLIGLSNATVQEIMHRRLQGLPTLSSEQISRLKNTGMSEKQILEVLGRGMSDQQAETFITQREANRNHSNTGFVRTRGRRPR